MTDSAAVLGGYGLTLAALAVYAWALVRRIRGASRRLPPEEARWR